MDDTIPQNTPQKQCTKCLNSYPLTTEYFHEDKWKKDGWKMRCKTCEKAHKKVYLSNPDLQEHYKSHRKAYQQLPETQEKRRSYRKEYRARPGIQEHEQAHQKAYYQRPEVKEQRRIHR